MERNITYWTFLHAILMLVATILARVMQAEYFLVWIVSASLLLFISLNYHTWSRLHPVGGYANHVTFGRFMLLIFALATYHVIHQYAFILLILLVMIMDGIDGYLARRFHQSTAFGEVFDMEVDAFLALSMCFMIWTVHPESWWVMTGGLLRYAFSILYWLIGWHRRKRPVMPASKLFAVLFFLSLLTPFILDWDLACWIVVGGSTIVAFSFVYEFGLYLLKVRE